MTGKKKTNLPPLMVEKVSAGFPSPAQQYLESPLDLNELMVPHPTGTYFVRVDGDSMINAGIHHNDILVVDCTLDPANGSIVVPASTAKLWSSISGAIETASGWRRQIPPICRSGFPME